MEMDLKDFVKLVSQFEDDNYGKESPNDGASKLAALMYEFKDLTNDERKKYLEKCDFSDERDKYFLEYLIEKNLTDTYTFIQDKTISFNYDLFNPYLDPVKRNYSQKWHVLVSLLAYLDIFNQHIHDKHPELRQFGPKGKINSIIIDKILSINGRSYGETISEWIKTSMEKQNSGQL